MHKPSAYKSKADFVRAQPLSMPTADVVAAGKAAGLSITAVDVAGTRNYDRRKGAGKGSSSTPLSRKDDARDAFRSLAIRIGLDRARALLDALEKEVGL